MSASRLAGRLSEAAASRPRAVLWALGFLLALQAGPWWRPTNDSCSYLSIARSLAEGEARNLGDPHLYYAPGYPAILAPTFLLSDRPFLAISILHVVFALLWLLAVYRWARRTFPDMSLALVALTAANVGLWTYQRLFLSEIPFAATMAWAALAFDAALRAEDRRTFVRAMLAAVPLSMALVAIRQVGIVVPAAFALAFFFRALKGRSPWARAVPAVLLALLPAAAVTAWIALADRDAAAGATTYVDRFAEGQGPVAVQVVEGLRLRVNEVGRLLLPGMFKAYSRSGTWLHPTMLLYLPLAAVVAWGWFGLLRRTGSVLAVALPLYVALYVIWPFDQGARFFMPLVPVLWACVLEALARAPRLCRPLVPVLVLAHLGVSLGTFAADVPGTARLHGRWDDVERVAALVRDAPERVAASRVDRKLVLMLQLALDRPVEDARRAPPGPEARWVVLGAEEAVPSGFEEIEIDAGDLRLARRRG